MNRNDAGVAAVETLEHGLGYNVVLKLMDPYLGQDYHLYSDNYYTSPQLVRPVFAWHPLCRYR